MAAAAAADRARGLSDPFAAASRLVEAARHAPMPAVLFLSGDDEWFVREGARRIQTAFQAAFPEGEVSTFDGAGTASDAIADASTVGLFSTNRLVVLEATDLLHGRKLVADDLDALLDEAAGAGDDRRALARLAKRARSLAQAAGVGAEPDAKEAARKVAGRVKRLARADDLAALLELAPPEADDGGGGAEALAKYAESASAGDNALLVLAVSPDRDLPATQALARRAAAADLSVQGDDARNARLAALGFERAMERNVVVDSEVYEILCSRGRQTGRAFLTEFDRLVAGAKGSRVTAEDAARLVDDEKKQYGSDFVEATVKRQFVAALHLLDRLMSSDDFVAFRPFGDKEGAPAKKGPKGEAAFFPLLGLLAAEFRRVLVMKAVLSQQAPGPKGARRADYYTFRDRVLPSLKLPPRSGPHLQVDGHPFMLHKAYLATFEWTLDELVDAMKGIAAIDEGVKTGTGDGRELLETFLLSRAAPAGAVRQASGR